VQHNKNNWTEIINIQTSDKMKCKCCDHEQPQEQLNVMKCLDLPLKKTEDENETTPKSVQQLVNEYFSPSSFEWNCPK